MDKINVHELVQVYREAQAHPEEFDQAARGYRGRDGSGMPIEAYAALRRAGADGKEPYWRPRPGEVRTLEGVYVSPLVCIPIARYAQEALGLTDIQAQQLFHARNSLDDIRRLIRQWTSVDPHQTVVTS